MKRWIPMNCGIGEGEADSSLRETQEVAEARTVMESRRKRERTEVAVEKVEMEKEELDAKTPKQGSNRLGQHQTPNRPIEQAALLDALNFKSPSRL